MRKKKSNGFEKWKKNIIIVYKKERFTYAITLGTTNIVHNRDTTHSIKSK